MRFEHIGHEALNCLQNLALLGLSLLLGLGLLLGLSRVKFTNSALIPDCEGLRRPQFPHCSPAGFNKHPEQGPVTVVLMNFNRPDNIRRIVDNMVNYGNVAEIMVVSNNPNSSFTYSHEKVVVLDMIEYEDELGVAVRFKACLLAMNWHILIADDDLMITEAGLSNLLTARHKHPRSIVSFWGRDFDPDNPTYVLRESGPGHHGIALTKGLLLDTCACRAFWAASHLMHDIAHEAAVTWNGEDIFMSLVSRKILGGAPYITPYKEGHDVQELGEGDAAISGTTNHIVHRNKFLQTAIRRLHCF